MWWAYWRSCFHGGSAKLSKIGFHITRPYIEERLRDFRREHSASRLGLMTVAWFVDLVAGPSVTAPHLLSFLCRASFIYGEVKTQGV